VIVGGDISAAYLANHIKKLSTDTDVLIASEEAFSPYDRIHLCALVDNSATLKEITLPIDPLVNIALNEKIISIDSRSKKA